MQVTKHKVAVINYVLKDEQGNTIDQSTDGNFAYIHGTQSIVPGLENAMEGKKAGDQLDVSIPPEDAYGDRQLENIQTVTRDMFPPDVELKIGMQFQAQSPQGQPLILTITSIEGNNVVVDGNHPLAGKQLNFNVEVVDVRDATEEEIEHNHVHGVGDNQH
ncbi:MAG: peptidylprolyl isomerase [Gammaproteobacteria bacterium]|nr:peptidylprolyl isomerase [Gammaproteobacteria bacterium]NIN60999.1 peptidylprolyl isomerase [Gammaproteobacteria bacterium]NIO62623.1 peptidylprolyl isomerase [Gammaproteobacteria bacterium]NIP49460.1 peptidylprolyl isomerase [Gammaproteobacteria bacterium]NIQ10684.1 peptidylprolyl isomerase [Gammaproteobacteria bacterium]